MTLEIARSTAGRATVLRLAGEVDLATAGRLRDLVVATLRSEPRVPLVVDLDRVELLDSSGVRALVEGTRVARDVHASYRVVNARDTVRQVLEITGLLTAMNT
jgi:anti-sigma B factor antagonist